MIQGRKGFLIEAAVLGALGTGLFVTSDAEAVPIFARKYRTSCMTCHVSFPKLNPFGEAFRKNGYRIPEGDAAFVKEEPVPLGAEAWKRIWPNTVWPGAIPSEVPASFMVHNRIRYRENNATSEVDLNFPFEFKLFTGGTFDEHISFFGEWVFLDDAGDETSEVGKMFLEFDDLLTHWFGEDALNLKVGRLEIAATEGFRHRDRQNITTYLVGNYNVGSSGWNFRDNFSGIEAEGILNHRFSYAAGITNGEGGIQDGNDAKDVYYRLAYKFGGLSPDGLSGTEGMEGLPISGGWEETSLTIGSFGYLGRSALTTGGNSHTNRFFRAGGDARIRYGGLDLFGAYTFGEDDNPANAGEVETNAWFVEADYPLYPWLLGGFRAEGVTFDNADDQARYIPTLIGLLRPNLRLIGEYVIYEGEEDGNNVFLVDLAWVY